MTANQDDYLTAVLCQVVGVSSSGYYAARGRIPSQRAQEDAVLTEEIQALHAASRGICGAPRIHEDLMEQQWRIGRKRVARLMRGAGLQGVSRRKGTVTTRPGTEPAAADLVRRNFVADGPNRLWVADIAYVLPGGGHRRMEPQGRRLVHGNAHAPRAGDGRADDGSHPARGKRRDPSL